MSTNKKKPTKAKKREEENIILKTIREGYNLPEAYFDLEVEKATAKKNVATVLNLEQLTGDRFKDFYVETDKVREANPISSLEQLLNDPLNPYIKRLFSGFTGSGIITEESMKKSINYHKDIFASRIQERDDEIKIEFQEYLAVLFDIYNGNKIAPKKNLALLDLLRTRAVMKYDGEGFYDTHPFLDNFIKAYKNKKLKNEKQKTGEADASSSV